MIVWVLECTEESLQQFPKVFSSEEMAKKCMKDISDEFPYMKHVMYLTPCTVIVSPNGV